VIRALKLRAKKNPLSIAKALFIEAGIEATEMKRRTPVDTGALRGTYEVTKPDFGALGGDISVEIRVGGPAAEYAIHVHENLEAHHDVGQAKFMESVINESKPFFHARVAKRAKIIL
jgi:hypothetical protein